MLGDEADAVFDDKSRYARHRLIETMCRGEAYARPSIGRRKEIDALTLDAARAAWRDVVDRAPADLFLVGNLTVAEARRFAKRLALGGRGRLASLRRTVRKPAGRVRTVRESQEVTQAKLEMGFRTSVRHGQKQFPAYVLMNGVFGGTPVGKLFKVVREKASLCYSVYSAPERTKGLMLVHAGIDEKNYAKARRLILRQLDAVRAGEIETEQIEMARSMLVGALRTMRDSPHALIDFALERTVNGVGADLEGLLADLERVTVRDVARVARTVELDSVFLLRS
ncbi:MAG: insulinase family protein, partial [Planctomycetota bacterium]|nr:insulinase family protein [Planctomycetota bacterium]